MPVSSRARQHQQDQATLSRLLTADVTELWPYLLPAGLSQLAAALAGLLESYAAASGALAAEFYDEHRATAGAGGRFTAQVADPPALEQVAGSMSWATRMLRPARDSDVLDLDDPAAVETALTKAGGAAQRLAMNTGRETLAGAVTDDPAAVAWARIPTGSTTCPDCMLWCSRGAVYKSSARAGRTANARFVGDGEFKFHDHDDCSIVPVFAGEVYEPAPEIREWEQLYVDSTSGLSGKAARSAFRAAARART